MDTIKLLAAISLLLSIPLLRMDEWGIDYEVYEEGPRTVFEGTAWLNMSKDVPEPCFSYSFNLPPGRLAGPVISSDHNKPLLAFDSWSLSGDELEVLWCEGPPNTHPFTGEILQTLPTQIPRSFVFYVIKTDFGPDDLTKLLASWGEEDSPWDLNGDQTVGGDDLAQLLGSWRID